MEYNKVFLSLFNLIILIFNCFFIFQKIIENKDTIKGKEIDINFKNAENFLNLAFKAYNQISTYLNNKYNIKIYKRRKRKRKKISLYCVDVLNQIMYKRNLVHNLKNKFILRFNKYNPDYSIYDNFGKEHRSEKYKNSIKIALYSENAIPDFNEVDYGWAQAHINYLDRYFMNPDFIYENIKAIKIMRIKFIDNPLRKKFCAAVISNFNSTNGFRVKFINELNKYKKVDMGGKFMNNVGGPVKDKIKFYSSYKFSIAMENSEGDGYITEKIIDSFISGTLPIYYGDYNLDEYINPKSYILIKDEKNIKKKIKYIIEIDNDYKKYLKILKEKVLINENIDELISKERQKFIYNIFEQDLKKAKRIDG